MRIFVLNNGFEIWLVTASPDGVVTAARGSLAVRSDAGNATLWVNTSAGATGNTWTQLAFGVGAAFVNGGNAFGANASIGTNDAFAVSVETNNVVRMTFNTDDTIVPRGDGIGSIGTNALRWASMRAVAVSSGAYFEEERWDDEQLPLVNKVRALRGELDGMDPMGMHLYPNGYRHLARISMLAAQCVLDLHNLIETHQPDHK